MKRLRIFIFLFGYGVVNGCELEWDPGLVNAQQTLEHIAQGIEKQHDIQAVYGDLNELVLDDTIKKTLVALAQDAHKFPNWVSQVTAKRHVPFILHPQVAQGRKVNFGSRLKTFYLRCNTELDRAQNFAAIIGFFYKEQKKPQEFDDAVNPDYLPHGVLPNYFKNPLTEPMASEIA